MDGVEYRTTKQGLSGYADDEYMKYMVFACSLGSGDTGSHLPDYGSLATSKTKMEVDWVRVWQKP
jgi:hypothetical protein